jgi:hypothetical protein
VKRVLFAWRGKRRTKGGANHMQKLSSICLVRRSNAERTIIVPGKLRTTYNPRLRDSPDISIWIPSHIGTVEIAPCAVDGIMIGVFS